MIESKRPQRWDLVITRALGGFWIHRPLCDSHTAAKVDTFDAAVARGGSIAHLDRVDLWLVDDDLELQLLVNCRQTYEPERFVTCPSVTCWS